MPLAQRRAHRAARAGLGAAESRRARPRSARRGSRARLPCRTSPRRSRRRRRSPLKSEHPERREAPQVGVVRDGRWPSPRSPRSSTSSPSGHRFNHRLGRGRPKETEGLTVAIMTAGDSRSSSRTIRGIVGRCSLLRCRARNRNRNRNSISSRRARHRACDHRAGTRSNRARHSSLHRSSHPHIRADRRSSRDIRINSPATASSSGR